METYNVYLTTFDNPFDPFDDFLNWFLFDVENGYNSCGIVARITNIKSDFTQKEIDEEIERAIDRFIEHDDLEIYRKLKKPIKKMADTIE